MNLFVAFFKKGAYNVHMYNKIIGKNMTRLQLEIHLKTLDVAYELATKLYTKLLNDWETGDTDWETVREIMDTSHENINAIDRARLETQTLIVKTYSDIDVDFNEYNYNRDVDSQADEVDALNSVFGGEE